ncbi:MAG: hypothetical protein ACR2NR_00700, partial [Solirubrobacteraceae bacterium]
PAGAGPPPAMIGPAPPMAGRATRAGYLALDAVLGVEELAGFALSNRPRRERGTAAAVVLIAGRFPTRGDPLADFALTLADARVEASARPEAPAQAIARQLWIDYREDDGALTRAAALTALLLRHPLRCLRDRLQRGADEPGLAVLAPAAARLRRDADARVHPLGGAGTRSLAARLAALSGHPLDA